jgi:hypothetical protein
MEVLELMHAKLSMARRVLKDFIRHYEGMEDAPRLEKSNLIMDEVNSYLKIEENLVFPFIRRTGRHQDIIDRVRAVHEQIEYVTEHAIMIHVDEPGGEYYNFMVQLDNLLDLAAKLDEELVYPWARVHLSNEDQLYIATHLKGQMTHESLPSTGMTIY